MPAIVTSQLSQFACDVADGLGAVGQKTISSQYFYDDLGSSLFEAITLLPEYGLTRADERLLRAHGKQIASLTGSVWSIAELGSGSGRKTKYILDSYDSKSGMTYYPIDVSQAALSACERELRNLVVVKPICADWMQGLAQLARCGNSNAHTGRKPMLLLFLGSSIGNLEREQLVVFLDRLRSNLQPGDFFLLGADLVKDVDTMLQAYDDPTGVTAAFNLNLLGRMNRELQANFDLRSFAHHVRWSATEQRIEMHLLSKCDQSIDVGALETRFRFRAGETIWTESSHKFTGVQLDEYARAAGFSSIESWVDDSWAFAEVLWRA